ncbi:hypothetical protein DEDGFLLK_00119 [Lactiplantibacillus phage Gut-P1]|nr:hypothetical protein DEDGFLLK_00119 [Lactiplantibacillus phage Gut-P1]
MLKNKDIFNHPAYQYALNVHNGETLANKDVKIVADRFIKEVDDSLNGKGDYYFDINALNRVSKLLKLIIMATGPRRGQSAYDSLAGFQWFFFVNIFCWRHKDNHKLRRYQTATMLIPRKNGKTFISAVIFILLLILEPKYSKFYSVAPDLELSSMLKTQIDSLIDGSPELARFFKVNNKDITCLLTKNSYKPLANSNNRLDAREPVAFLADEVGALPNSYPINAMKSGQTLVDNPLGIIISTAYDSLDNPMTQEIQRATDKIKDGELYDPTYFALIYRPDKPKEWATNDEELIKVNPLSQEIPRVKERLLNEREDAVNYEDKRQNFLTKYMNIFVDGDEGEQFTTESELDRAELPQGLDWYGRDVFVGLDFAESHDNFGLAMVTFDEEHQKYVAKAWSFFPADRVVAKTKVEGWDYQHSENEGWGFSSGHETIDYGFVEDFFYNIESKYGVKIKGFGYDKWNARSTVAKFITSGYDGVEIPQNPRGLYPGTKLLREALQNGNFAYDKNDMLRQNFLNAKMVTDSNLSYFLNKKKSSGKIDMAAAVVDAMSLWEIEEFSNIMGGASNITLL